jgi:hypothetical protein
MSISIPCYKLYSNGISLYNEIFTDEGNSFHNGNKSIHTYEKFNHNKLSKQSRKKLERTIHNLLILAQPKTIYIAQLKKSITFRLAFITLTLAHEQVHSDKVIKQKILHQFLVEITKRFKVKNYIWKAERQQNGNLHFHLIVDKFIHWSELRDTWNRCQEKLGYVSRHRKAMKEFYKFGFKINERYLKYSPINKQKEYYAKGLQTDWNNPNTTDIHATKGVRELSNYFTKYMLKGMCHNRIRVKRKSTDIPRASITTVPDGSYWNFKENKKKSVSIGAKKYLGNVSNNGRIWGASYSLSCIKGVGGIFEADIAKEILLLEKLAGVRKFVADYCTCFFFDFKVIIKNGLKNIRAKLLKYIAEVTNQPIQLSYI